MNKNSDILNIRRSIKNKKGIKKSLKIKECKQFQINHIINNFFIYLMSTKYRKKF